jgi:hypothetical protein
VRDRSAEPEPPSEPEEHTLYEPLAEPAPPGAEGGETIFTAAKETVDRDHEDPDIGILLDAR